MNRLRNLFQIPEVYGEEHFRRRTKYEADYRTLAGCLLDHLDFASVLDVGCANGFLLSAFLAAGKRVGGLESSPGVVPVLPPELRPLVRIADFSAIEGSWDLVCCVEVAEHVPRKRSAELVERLTAAAGRQVFFTAAPPGQGGRGHINCRPRDEWIAMFAERGWSEDAAGLARLAPCLARLRTATWIAGNAILFRPS